MMSALTLPESGRGVGESIQCRNLVALVLCSLAEAEVVGWMRHSVRETGVHSEVPERRASVGDAVEVEETT